MMTTTMMIEIMLTIAMISFMKMGMLIVNLISTVRRLALLQTLPDGDTMGMKEKGL
jgi:hypothetical protein